MHEKLKYESHTGCSSNKNEEKKMYFLPKFTVLNKTYFTIYTQKRYTCFLEGSLSKHFHLLIAMSSSRSMNRGGTGRRDCGQAIAVQLR